ncbi:MAG: flavodoxin family protein [Desulfobacterales bacterium]|nr:flavodoxin family protein [Desulfobacterales bacterium]
MQAKILGISGSPVKDSNTDRLIQAVLDSSGLESEFIKLSSINVRPCLACKRCVPDNLCKVNDDFPELAEKIKTAKALVIGGYIPYSQIDGFTKALLERFWSLRHQTNLLKGKLGATVLTGCAPEPLAAVNQSLAAEMTEYENMDLIGQLTVPGNIPCAFCGKGDECEMSGVKQLLDPGIKASDIRYTGVEDQQDIWKEAIGIGRQMGDRLK